MTTVSKLKSTLPPAAFAVLGMGVLMLGWHDLQRLGHVGPAPVAISAGAGEPSTAQNPITAQRPPLDQFALFGTAAAPASETTPAPVVPVIDESVLPDSSAGYQLYGIIEADRPADARAILGTSDGDQHEYRVGDDMPDGARVHAVRERAVIFERDGALERLALPAAESSGAAGARSPVSFAPGRLPGAAGRAMRPPARFVRPYDNPPPAPIAPMAPTEVPPPPPDQPPESSPDLQ